MNFKVVRDKLLIVVDGLLPVGEELDLPEDYFTPGSYCCIKEAISQSSGQTKYLATLHNGRLLREAREMLIQQEQQGDSAFSLGDSRAPRDFVSDGRQGYKNASDKFAAGDREVHEGGPPVFGNMHDESAGGAHPNLRGRNDEERYVLSQVMAAPGASASVGVTPGGQQPQPEVVNPQLLAESMGQPLQEDHGVAGGRKSRLNFAPRPDAPMHSTRPSQEGHRANPQQQTPRSSGRKRQIKVLGG